MWWDVVSISGFWSKLWVWDNPMIEWGYYNRLHWIFGCSSKGIISSMSLCRKQENSTVECQHPLADHTYLTLNKFEDGGGGLWTVRYNEGPQGPCGDNKITKNAITFERIEITEFCLKIWDPWTLPHTSRVHLMCRWGVSYPKWHPSNVKNYSIGHKSETDEPKPKKKVILDNIFLHLSANFEVKIQNTQCYRSRLTFWHLENRHLTAQQMATRWDTQKSKIG